MTLRKVFSSLTEFLETSCPYEAYGCAIKLTRHDMSNHINVCPTASSYCIGLQCRLKFPFKGLVEEPLLHPGKTGNKCYQLLQHVEGKPTTWKITLPLETIVGPDNTLFTRRFRSQICMTANDLNVRLGIQIFVKEAYFHIRPIWMEDLETLSIQRPNVKIVAGCPNLTHPQGFMVYRGNPTFQDFSRHANYEYQDQSHKLSISAPELKQLCCKNPCLACGQLNFCSLLHITFELQL